MLSALAVLYARDRRWARNGKAGPEDLLLGRLDIVGDAFQMEFLGVVVIETVGRLRVAVQGCPTLPTLMMYRTPVSGRFPPGLSLPPFAARFGQDQGAVGMADKGEVPAQRKESLFGLGNGKRYYHSSG
jgi:hypothetical protein